MQKKLIFIVSLAALLIYFVNSCSKDEWNGKHYNEAQNQLVQNAMNKFYKLVDDSGIVGLRSSNGNGNNGNENENGNTGSESTGKGNGTFNLKPRWEYTRIEQDNTWQVVDILLEMETTFNFSLPNSVEKYNYTGKKQYLISKTSLIYLNHKQSGAEEMFLMTIIPEPSYSEHTKFKPFDKMSYLKIDSKFDGVIQFHDMEGKYMYGVVYKNGQATGTLESVSGTPDYDLVKTRSGTCYYWMITTKTQICWFYGTLSGEYEDCFYATEEQAYFLFCDYGGTGGNGTPGGPVGGTITPGAKAMGDIVKSMSLNDPAKRKLLDAIEAMMYECGYNDFLTNIQKKFTDVVIDPTVSYVAAYQPSTGKLTFSSENAIEYHVVAHEFIHLYQDWRYPGGIDQYIDAAGYPNIEFEARFLVDLFYRLYNPYERMYSGAPVNSPYYNDYKAWLDELYMQWTYNNLSYYTVMGHPVHGLTYNNFLQNFRDYGGTAYNKPILSSFNLIPILDFVSYSPCHY